MYYEEARKHVYSLESIRGDMWIKYIEYAKNNPKADLTTLQLKLKAMEDASNFIMELIERVGKAEYETKKNEILLNKLLLNGLQP